MKNKKVKCFIIFFSLVAVLTAFLFWGNKIISVNNFVINSSKIPDEFDGFTIVQISDLHNTEFGKDNMRLLDKVREAKPDIILITGDLVDSRRTDIGIGADFATDAQKIAPTYYVSGNHEARITEYKELEKRMIESGVTILNNKSDSIEIGSKSISVFGIEDLNFNFSDSYEKTLHNSLEALEFNNDSFNILLAHHPEWFDIYALKGFDLVFSGHAHGGQIRLPFVGGVFAPGQGLFPKYDSGIYSKNETTMIVSRGLGNSLFPIRINNSPEIIVAKLNKTEVQLEN